MTLAGMRTILGIFQEEDHKTFVKALISIETGNLEEKELDELYFKYMNNDMEPLINPMFYEDY